MMSAVFYLFIHITVINTHLNRKTGALRKYRFDGGQNGERNKMMSVVYNFFMYITCEPDMCMWTSRCDIHHNNFHREVQ